MGDPDGDVQLTICPRTMQMKINNDVHCAELSEYVDWSFDTIGSTLVHEYVHWAALVQKALDSKKGIKQLYIGDCKGTDPKDGYGPYNVLRVRESFDPTDNADNFAWFATEAYWHRICRPMDKEQYGPGRKGAPVCKVEGNTDLKADCHPI